MKYSIYELIDREKVLPFLVSFCGLIKVPTGLIDLDGNILKIHGKKMLATGYMNICKNFHRKHPESLAKCIESDRTLLKQVLTDKKYTLCKCPHGLSDAAVPIFVDGEHIASLFMGQFFLEQPDRNYFFNQAAHYGYHTENYLDALDDVPILDEKEVEKKLSILCELAELIADMGIKKKELLDLKNELEQRVEIQTLELEEALAEIKTLSGILPLCSFCKKIRDEKGCWEQVDVYICKHSQADISHSVCPECMEKYYPETYTSISSTDKKYKIA